jgi:O-antigen/teichoic acid export membrane protein
VRFTEVYKCVLGVVLRNVQGGGYGLSMLAVACVGLIGNLISVRMLTPYEVGVIQAALLVPTYLSILGAGLYQGITQKIASHIANNQNESLVRIIEVGSLGSYFVSILGGIASTVYLFVILSKRPGLEYLLCLPIIVLSLTLEPRSQFYDAVCLGFNDYKRVALTSVRQAGVTFLGIIAIILYGFHGAIFWRCLHIVSRWIMRVYSGNITRRVKWDSGVYSSLLKTGFPVIIGNAINNYYAVADRTIAVAFLDATAVGQLVLSNTVATVGNILHDVLSIWVFSRASLLYGNDSRIAERKLMFIKVLAFSIIMIAPVSLLFVFGLDFAITRFRPEFTEGLNAAKVVSGFLFTNGYSCFLAFGMLGTRRYNIIVLQIIALTTLWLCGWWSCKLGYGFFGIVVCKVLVSLLLYVYTGISVFRSMEVHNNIKVLSDGFKCEG